MTLFKSKLARNLHANRKQRVVAYGTSLTEKGSWVNDFESHIKSKYGALATVSNCGGSGQWSKWGVENLEERVIQRNPDTVFIEFSINDCVARFDCSVALAQANLEQMLDRILKSNPECELILMTMTPGDGYPQGHKSYRPNVAAYYDMYRDVAGERSLMLIDHYPNWQALQLENKLLFDEYIPDSVHPTDEACSAIVTPVVIKALGV